MRKQGKKEEEEEEGFTLEEEEEEEGFSMVSVRFGLNRFGLQTVYVNGL